MAKVLRDLNAECPEGMAYGLVVLFEEAGAPAEDQVDNAHVRWYATAAEMYAAWEMASTFDAYLMDSAAFKRLDDLATTQYTIVCEDEEEDTEMPVITWRPKTSTVEVAA